MTALQGQAGELRFTVEITRKDDGRVEQFELVGRITDEQLKELHHGSDPHDGRTQRGD
jgi:hypothetical protein